MLTEEQIERAVSRKIDALDARFMAGAFEQDEYDARMCEIRKWAEIEYRFRDRRR